MTADAPALQPLATSAARAAAVVTWAYAAGFGVPTVPVSIYLLKRGSLPSFFGLFDMYGGPWSSRFDDRTFAALLISYLPVTAAAACGRPAIVARLPARRILSLALLPIEAAYWLGFALPIPWLLGTTRAALVTSAWKHLE